MKKILIIVSILLASLTIVIILNYCKSPFDKADSTIKKLSLDEKIGQMLMIYYTSDEYDESLDNSISEYMPGGFILMEENIKNSNKLIELINNMQKNSKIPMFISIDEEGGLVQRLKNLEDINVTDIPSMNDIGKTSKEDAYEAGNIVGKELKIFGINMDFAPVIDINTNSINNVIGNRSFGSNANLVSEMGISFAKGLRENNIIPVYKHFPGHGDTTIDPHEELPIIEKTKEELYEKELIPFKNAIADGAEIIMVGHFAVPNITNNNMPSSLSKEVITDILIDELGFNGVIITDALNMQAITDNFSKEEIVVNAINAGVDILLMPGSSSEVTKIIKDAVQKNIITEDRINDSVKKILTLKYKYKLNKRQIKLKINEKEFEEHQIKINKIIE